MAATRAMALSSRVTRGELQELRERTEAKHAEIDHLRQELDRASAQARHDPLTGSLNRKGFAEAMEREVARARRQDAPLCVALLDVDNFKSINDRFGHDEGDRVLQRCATLLSRKVRSGDALIRWGGEEFLIVLPGCRLEAAQELAERIRAAMAQEQDAVVGSITLSLGVGAWQPGECSSTLLRRTDQALYRAKTSGRNQVAVAP